MTTVQEIMRERTSCWVGKKGAKYLTERGGELALTTDQGKALAFTSQQDLDDFISVAVIDDRNAAVVGRTYDATPLSKQRPRITPHPFVAAPNSRKCSSCGKTRHNQVHAWRT